MTTRPFWSGNDTVAIACQPPVIRYDAIILEVICTYKCVIPPDIHRTAAQTSSQDASAATYKVLHHEATSNAPPRIRPVRHSPKALIGQHGRARRDRHKRRISSPFSCINSGASSSEARGEHQHVWPGLFNVPWLPEVSLGCNTVGWKAMLLTEKGKFSRPANSDSWHAKRIGGCHDCVRAAAGGGTAVQRSRVAGGVNARKDGVLPSRTPSWEGERSVQLGVNEGCRRRPGVRCDTETLPGSGRTAAGEPARIEGKHGADHYLAVLLRRRAPHRAGHECRTSILPMKAFVHILSAIEGRLRPHTAACSCARVAAIR